MFAHARLLRHGAQLMTRQHLRLLDTPEPDGRWKPISHTHLVEALHIELVSRGLQVAKEEYAIYRNGLYLFGCMILTRDPGVGSSMIGLQYERDNSIAIAFRHANDKTTALRMVAGLEVWVCDNMMLSGEEMILVRKHTSGFDLPSEVALAFTRLEGKFPIFLQDLERLKHTAMSDPQAKALMHDVFTKKILPLRYLPKVSNAYFHDPEHADAQFPRTLWNLHNVCTTFIKELTPNAIYQSTVKLGQIFRM